VAEDGMIILKDAIGKGGKQRTRAFDFIDTKFGSDMKSGGKRALETYRELYAIAQLAGGQGACKEFTERFFPMLPEGALLCGGSCGTFCAAVPHAGKSHRRDRLRGWAYRIRTSMAERKFISLNMRQYSYFPEPPANRPVVPGE
jgi:hypothetical protein